MKSTSNKMTIPDNGQLLATIDANRTNHDRSLDYNNNYGDSGLYCYRIKAVGSNVRDTARIQVQLGVPR